MLALCQILITVSCVDDANCAALEWQLEQSFLPFCDYCFECAVQLPVEMLLAMLTVG